MEKKSRMEDQKISRKEDMNEKDIGRKDMMNSLYSAYITARL